jgi:protein-disulfide isomerase
LLTSTYLWKTSRTGLLIAVTVPHPTKNRYICFIFRHFPQIEIHPHAQRAAEAAEAAAVQGQFWQMHEMLFIHQQALENGYLVEYANRLELDMPRFLQDLSQGVYVDRIIADIQGGYRSGIEIAPALFINGIRYREPWTIEQLIAAISQV